MYDVILESDSKVTEALSFLKFLCKTKDANDSFKDFCLALNNNDLYEVCRCGNALYEDIKCVYRDARLLKTVCEAAGVAINAFKKKEELEESYDTYSR